MSILVYAESWEGKFRKSTFEVNRYKIETNTNFKLSFCKTGPSLLQEDPYQTAIPDKVNAVIEIGQ